MCILRDATTPLYLLSSLSISSASSPRTKRPVVSHREPSQPVGFIFCRVFFFFSCFLSFQRAGGQSPGTASSGWFHFLPCLLLLLLFPFLPTGRSSVTGNRLSRLISFSAVSSSSFSVSFPSNGPVVSHREPSQPVSFGRSLRRAFPPLPLKKEKEKTLNLFESVLSRTVTNLFDWAKVK